MVSKVRHFMAIASLSLLLVAGASAQINVNQTDGFGKDQLLTFTYGQNFSCIHQPFDDLDNNGKVAAIDPAEFQRPRCVIGRESTIGPTGDPVQEVEKLYVIAPFFETDVREPAFTPELGVALKSLFGFVPDAFKIHPGVAVQCPEPGLPLTKQTGAPGTCTMHYLANRSWPGAQPAWPGACGYCRGYADYQSQPHHRSAAAHRANLVAGNFRVESPIPTNGLQLMTSTESPRSISCAKPRRWVRPAQTCRLTSSCSSARM